MSASKDELVSGDGWISDESDFHGNARKKRRLESQVARVNPLQLIRDWQKQQNIQPSAPDLAPAVVKEPQEEALLHNDFEGRPEKGRQLSETVTEFVKRMPPLKSVTIDGWIWCAKPIVVSKKDGKKKVQRFDLGEFVDKGQVLLEDFDEEKAKVESEYEGKAASTITRKLGPFRDRLKEDILEAAIKHGVTSGKWMLFPSEEEVTRTWRTVCESLVAGELGPTAKVAAADHSRDTAPKRRLICIYTYDFSDLADVRRVLDQVLELGLVSRDGAGIWYKCDAYTYLGIESDNQYKLKASLYGSKDLLTMSKPGHGGKTEKKAQGKTDKKSGLDGWLSRGK